MRFTDNETQKILDSKSHKEGMDVIIRTLGKGSLDNREMKEAYDRMTEERDNQFRRTNQLERTEKEQAQIIDRLKNKVTALENELKDK